MPQAYVGNAKPHDIRPRRAASGFSSADGIGNGFRACRTVRLYRYGARYFYPHVLDAGIGGHPPVHRTRFAGACAGCREPDSGPNTANCPGAADRADSGTPVWSP